jgi:hypothetical protein
MIFYSSDAVCITTYQLPICRRWSIPFTVIGPSGETTEREVQLPYQNIITGKENIYGSKPCDHNKFIDLLEWFPTPTGSLVSRTTKSFDLGISLSSTILTVQDKEYTFIDDGIYGPFSMEWWPATSAFWDLKLEVKGNSIRYSYWGCYSTRWRPEYFVSGDWWVDSEGQHGCELRGDSKDNLTLYRDYSVDALQGNPTVHDCDSVIDTTSRVWDDFTQDIGGQLFLLPPLTLDDDQKYSLCREAVNDLDIFGVNWLENLSSLSMDDLINAAPNLVKKIQRAVKNGITDKGQLLSDLYLSKKYGFDNLVRDVNSIQSGVRTLQDMIRDWIVYCHGGKTYDQTEAHATVRCSPLDDGIYWTTMLGINVRPSTLWACVPFSFAVDWVLKCGENLKEIETAYDWGKNRWNVTEIVYSAKDHHYLRVPELDGWFCKTSQVRYKRYKRWVEYQLPNYVYQSPEYGVQNLKNHVFEIGALTLNSF